MNNAEFMTDDDTFVVRALNALAVSVGILGEILHDVDLHADSAVLLQIGERTLRYDCEVKKKVDRYALVLDLIRNPGDRHTTLLVSSPLSEDMANRCRELGLQFMDTAGNAYINDGKGIYIYVTGRRGKEESKAAASETTITPATLRVMFAFLSDPSLLNAPYRDISSRAMVSTGAIGKVFETLEARRLIGAAAGQKRMIRSPEIFLKEWASGYVNRLKPKLKKYRFATDDLEKFRDRWSPEFKISAWGGEDGAAALTKHLQPEDATIYIDMEEPHALRELVKDFRLRTDPNGRLEVVEMFWNSDYFTGWFPTVPPHLIYADLVATHDSRNIAVAQQIASDVITHVHDTTR